MRRYAMDDMPDGEHRAAVCYVCGAGPVVDWVSEDANDARAEFLPVCDAHPWGDE